MHVNEIQLLVDFQHILQKNISNKFKMVNLRYYIGVPF